MPIDNVWRETHRVLSSQIDASGRLAVPALLGLMEEAAGNSARSLRFSVEDLAADGITWILARLRLRFAGWPAWRDEVTIETWPSGTDRLRAFREYRLLGAGGRLLGSGTSVWLVLDLAGRRPVRVPARLATLCVPDRPRELGGVAGELQAPSRIDASRDFRVRWDDLDLNRHANHTRYVGWALETVPAELRERCRIAELGVDFQAEARYDEEIVAESETAADGRSFLHRILRPAGRRTLAVLGSSWTSAGCPAGGDRARGPEKEGSEP